MKPNQQTTPAAPSWARAKGLLADLKSAVRRSLAAQVLLGKELSNLKQRLGFTHGGDRKGSSRQFGDFNSWDKYCQEEIEIPARSADRWIQCFLAALKRAKARKAREPQASRLLEIPADELTGDELEALADLVNGLVDGETQAGLLEELGIVRPSKPTPGGDTSGGEENLAAAGNPVAMAAIFFRNIFNDLSEIERQVSRSRLDENFESRLYALPLKPGDSKDMIGLLDYRDQIERIKGTVQADMDDLLAKLGKAIEAKMAGGSSKRIGKKVLTKH